ncbi:protein LTO1 homolog isoform X2 [Embiotoca jacksoni]|uniref:protein LTO1 homolog isoform X2 n=1 Tax=Embiotoca jacksoni TaxID=100190 RepID=UPI003703A349
MASSSRSAVDSGGRWRAAGRTRTCSTASCWPMKSSEETVTGRASRGGPAGGCRTAADTGRPTGPGCPRRCPSTTVSPSPGNVSSNITQTSNPMCCRKRVKALESLLVLIHNVPLEDPQSATLQENMERLRAKFRQVCSMLSVPADFKDFIRTAEGTSF